MGCTLVSVTCYICDWANSMVLMFFSFHTQQWKKYLSCSTFYVIWEFIDNVCESAFKRWNILKYCLQTSFKTLNSYLYTTKESAFSSLPPKKNKKQKNCSHFGKNINSWKLLMAPHNSRLSLLLSIDFFGSDFVPNVSCHFKKS